MESSSLIDQPRQSAIACLSASRQIAENSLTHKRVAAAQRLMKRAQSESPSHPLAQTSSTDSAGPSHESIFPPV
jgi:hypothetical protein